MSPALWPHQQDGVERALKDMGWNGGKGGHGLFFEMRTGKTRTATEVGRRLGARRILVLCPSQSGNVPKVWAKEIPQAWADSPPIYVMEGTAVERARQVRKLAERPCIMVCNFEIAWRPELAKAIHSVGWDLVIADELHKLKAPKGKAATFAARLARQVPNRLGLTGTPMPHSALDVWAQYEFLDWTIFPSSFTRYRMYYSRPAGYSEKKDRDTYSWPGRGGVLAQFKFQHMDELHDKMYSIATRVRTEDVFPDMPEVIEETRSVALEVSARRMYREMERHMVTEIGQGIVTAANGGVKVMRLLQLTGGSLVDMEGEEHEVSAAKASLFGEVLEDIDEPVVVFARFTSELKRIRAVVAAQGKTSSEVSGHAHELDDWQAGKTQVLVVQIQAGGAGLDFTRAAICIYYSHRSLNDYEQSRMRILGPMQKRTALILHLVCAGTQDETVYQALLERRDVNEAVVDRLALLARQAVPA